MIGVPELPANWHIKYRFNYSVTWWKSDTDTIGHISKGIEINSTCRIENEYDRYNFKSIKGVLRYLSVHTYYSQGKKLAIDSIVYEYKAGFNTNRKISRQEADSILAAEKVAKDY